MSFLGSIRLLWQRVRLAVAVFRRGIPRPDRETDKAIAEFISGLRKPGFPCPQCGAPIIVGIAELLASSTICCAKCQLELKMSWQQDPRARRALEDLQVAARRVEQARRFGSTESRDSTIH